MKPLEAVGHHGGGVQQRAQTTDHPSRLDTKTLFINAAFDPPLLCTLLKMDNHPTHGLHIVLKWKTEEDGIANRRQTEC